MRTKTRLTVILIILSLSVSAQKPSITLTFTAQNNGQYVPLDSIRIENLTQGGDTTLYAPDTVLLLNFLTGYGENISTGDKGLAISQNYPNPIQGKTTINIYVPGYENVRIRISDILGRELINSNFSLEPGIHTFTFIPGSENFYFLTATTDREKQSLKMFNSPLHSSSSGVCQLEYSGKQNEKSGFKSGKELNGFFFSPGDSLQFIANSGHIEKTIIDTPTTDTTYIFNFLPVPCPKSVNYQGQIYNTVIIGNKCWLKENLNVGIMIYGDQNQTNNGQKEKYCYNDSPSYCSQYGGLYQWNETMEYITFPGTRGICPPGWHIPTDEEWKELEGQADSQFGYPDSEWNKTGWRGFDAGINLKSPTGWYGTNLTNFGALPSGLRTTSGQFSGLSEYTYWWLSSDSSPYDVTTRALSYNEVGSLRENTYEKALGFSVRCLQDNNIPASYFSASPTNGSVPLIVNFTDLSTNNPTSWQWIFGDGGTSAMQNPTHTYNMAGIYTVELTVTNSYGANTQIKSNYIYVLEVGVGAPCPDTPTVTDIDGNVYNTVYIGSQCWMAENLKTTNYRNGTAIPNVIDISVWNDLTTGAYCWYDNDISWKAKYGALYNWFATVDANGLCPSGWHVPSDDEFKGLTEYIGGSGSPHGNELKSCLQENSPLGGDCNTSLHPRWNSSNIYWGIDCYGFSFLPGGYRTYTFLVIGHSGYLWSSSEYSTDKAWVRAMGFDYDYVYVGNGTKQIGISVRCLRD